MQVRIVRLNSRNPIVAIFFIAAVLALLAVVFTAGMALLAGGAVLGAAGYLVRRVFGGKSLGASTLSRERVLVLGDEVFPPSPTSDTPRLPEVAETPQHRVEPTA